MNITICSNDNKTGNLHHCKENRVINIFDNKFSIEEPAEINNFIEGKKSLKIISDQPKILIEIHKNVYHNIVNTYGIILNALKIFNNPLFIFNTYTLRPGYLDHNLIEFFYCFLKENNINRILIDPALHNQILINNFYYMGGEQPVPNPINLINEKFSKYLKNNEDLNKKVYISRKNIETQTFEYENKDKELLKDIKERLFDEHVLEQYFRRNNFEIVYPETFNSFIDQINYFNKVKTLVSLSGASSLNGIFMQPGANILEISTDLITPHGDSNYGNFVKSHHHFFHNIAHERDIFFYSIKNDTKQSKDIINKIESNKILRGLIHE
jgi:hypothetical protein